MTSSPERLLWLFEGAGDSADAGPKSHYIDMVLKNAKGFRLVNATSGSDVPLPHELS